MPAAYAHELCAKKALTLLSPIDREIITRRRPAYLLGSQGPDLLYFYGTLPPLPTHKPNRTGLQLHRQGGRRMARELLARGRGAEENACAWALGYLCHWALDASTHPYVLSRISEHKYAHGLIEHGIDTQLYQQEHEGVPRQMAFLEEMTEREIRPIAILFASATQAVLPECTLTVKDIQRAARDARRFHRFIYSPNGKRYRNMCFIERLIFRPGLITSHMPPPRPLHDPLNLQRRAWRSPNLARHDDECRTTVPELLNEAAITAAVNIEAALAYWDGRKSLDEALEKMGNARMDDGCY